MRTLAGQQRALGARAGFGAAPRPHVRPPRGLRLRAAAELEGDPAPVPLSSNGGSGSDGSASSTAGRVVAVAPPAPTTNGSASASGHRRTSSNGHAYTVVHPTTPIEAAAEAPAPGASRASDAGSDGRSPRAAFERIVAPAAQATGLINDLTAGTTDRPFVPVVDYAELVEMLLGDPEKALQHKSLYGVALASTGPARLYSPRVPKPPGAPAPATLPLMFYLPGIDGTGLAAYRQFPRLTRAFDLRCLIIPPSDRCSFEQLVDHVAGLVKAELDGCDAGRPVYLMGESFGGLMCLALALTMPQYIDRLVLINTATAFTSSPWPSLGPLLAALPPEAYKLLPGLLAPVMANPVSMALNDVDPGSPPAQQVSDFMYGLVDLLPQLPALRLVMPRETLLHRLQLLTEGNAWLKPRLRDVRQRCLVIGGGRDLLIPSGEEAERLGKALPRARVRVLPERSHALLTEAGVDLPLIMEEEGFYVTERVMSNGRASTSATDGGGAAFGTPAPVQLPTRRELAADSSGFVATINRLTSPVFYSTGADGVVRHGLGGVPVHARPLLLVGNHQFFAGDMYPMIEQFVNELGVLPRGLAHPLVFAGPEVLTAAGEATGMRPSEQRDNTANAAGFSSLLSTYGAVPVHGKNMHKLLSHGEIVLLYPGGAREACKRRGEAYSLMWPDKAEFVRMAAKFGATIVPFGAIGCDEAVTTLVNPDELDSFKRLLPQPPALPFDLPFDLPFLPRKSNTLSDEQRRALIPRARVGVNATLDDSEAFAGPGIFVPNAPRRTYFVFRKPIVTSPELASDRAACQELYRTVKAEVEDGIAYLLRKREQDPYKDLLPRLIYEASWGGSRRAPSFEP